MDVREKHAQKLYQNCIHDSCHDKDFHEIVCHYGAALATSCVIAENITVDWRDELACSEYVISQ